jgi:hypothetical protein
MNVTLPDGTVITNVPDDITKEQLDQKLQANGIDVSKFQPTLGQEVLASPAGRFISGAGNFIDAGAQLLPRALSTVSSLGGFNPNPVSRYLDEETKRVDEMVALKKRTMEAAKQATGQTGVDISGFTGEALSLPNLALMKQLAPMAKTIPGLIEAGALTGAVGGALSPVTENPESFAAQKALQTGAGASLGAVLGPVGQYVGRGYELAKALAQPFTQSGREKIVGRTMRGQIRPSDVGDTINQLTDATEIVPGSKPTVGEIVGEAGGNIPALERQARSKFPEIFTPIDVAGVEARRGAIGTVAGDVGKKEFFEIERKAAADALYKEAYKTPLNIFKDPVTNKILPKADRDAATAEITELMQLPAIKKATKDAIELAQNAGENIKDPKGSIQGLHYTKLALDKQISEASSTTEKAILMGVKEKLMGFLQKQSPKYAEAVATYAEASKPINQMEVGEYLKNKLIPALGEQGGILNESPSAYAQALRSPNTARTATGFKGATLENVFANNPEGLKTLEAIAQDLARKNNLQALGRTPGSNTYQNLAMANMASQTGLPFNLVNMPYVSAPIRKIYEGTSETMQQQLAQALANPELAAKLIAAAAPEQRGKLMAAALKGQLTPAMFAAPTTEFMNQ